MSSALTLPLLGVAVLIMQFVLMFIVLSHNAAHPVAGGGAAGATAAAVEAGPAVVSAAVVVAEGGGGGGGGGGNRGVAPVPEPPLPPVSAVVLHLEDPANAASTTLMLANCIRGLRQNAKWVSDIYVITTAGNMKPGLSSAMDFDKAKEAGIYVQSLSDIGLHEPLEQPAVILRQLRPDVLDGLSKYVLLLHSNVIAIRPTDPKAFLGLQSPQRRAMIRSAGSNTLTWKPLTRRHETMESLRSIPVLIDYAVVRSLSPKEAPRGADILPVVGAKCDSSGACNRAAAPVPNVVTLSGHKTELESYLDWARAAVLVPTPPVWVALEAKDASHSQHWRFLSVNLLSQLLPPNADPRLQAVFSSTGKSSKHMPYKPPTQPGQKGHYPGQKPKPKPKPPQPPVDMKQAAMLRSRPRPNPDQGTQQWATWQREQFLKRQHQQQQEQLQQQQQQDPNAPKRRLPPMPQHPGKKTESASP